MKLISWNVNGLRACLQKGLTEFLAAESPDVFCVQETKIQQGQADIDDASYRRYYACAEKKGYSGTAIMTKQEPLYVTYGIGIPAHDTEGRVITAEFDDIYLVTVYTPNAQRELTRLAYRMTWEDAFRDYLRALDEKKPVIVCGDMNVAHQDIDVKNAKSNHGNAGFTDEEREKFGQLLQAGFVDTFRTLHPDEQDRYSWWSYMFHAREHNVGWRIDYFLVSARILSRVRRADILSEVMGSDHCPVLLELA